MKRSHPDPARGFESRVPASPARLVDGEDDVARLIRASGSVSAPSVPPRPFSQLLREHELATGTRRWVKASALAAVACGALFLGSELSSRELSFSGQAYSIGREPPADAPHVAPGVATQPTPDAVVVPGRETEGDEEKPAGSSLTLRHQGRRAVAASDCASLAAREPHAAISCYANLTLKGGTEAELALLETARLQRRALFDDGAALLTLNQYAARFPAGALAQEATLSRIEVLIALGRKGEARGIAEEAAQSSGQAAGTFAHTAARLALEEGDCEKGRELLALLKARGGQVADLLPLEGSCR